MNKFTRLTLLFLFLTPFRIFATTWDEPWMDKIIQHASSFVLAKVDSCNEHKGIYIDVIKTLAGKEIKGHIAITDFYLLRLCSSSSDGEGFFHVNPTDSCYFLLSTDKDGNYCLPTPTSGYAPTDEGKVIACYRHSYHMALVPADVYEHTMVAIFNNYHHLDYDKASMTAFVQQYLSMKPAPMSPSSADTFFLQHVALECVYHLKLKVDQRLLFPFLRDSSNFHNQVSGARALAATPGPDSKTALLKVLTDSATSDFVKVICIWTLQSYQDPTLLPQFKALIPKASDGDNGFGGNIMDPRVCTHFPTVKQALEEAVAAK